MVIPESSIALRECSYPPTFSEVVWHEISKDWTEVSSVASKSPKYSLYFDSTHLHFYVCAPFQPKPQQGGPSFTPGLWKEQVAELFLKGKDTEYLEVHIAPSLKWWAARFRDYRDLLQEEPNLKIAIAEEREDERWYGRISLSRSELATLGILLLEETSLHISFIFGQRFFSTGKPPCKKPDFHRSELFCQPQIQYTVTG